MNYRKRIRLLEHKILRTDFHHRKLHAENKFPILMLSQVKVRLFENYKLNYSVNTCLSYENSYDNLIRLIGDKDVNSVQKSDLEDFKLKRSNEVNLVSTNIDIRNIKAIFNKMVELEIIDHSNISGVKQFKIQNRKNLAIETADLVRILNEAGDVQMNHIIRFTLLTASRISEVLSVKIRDIDFQNGILNIYQKKTNCFKTLPVTDRIKQLIIEIAESSKDMNIMESKDSYLFYNKNKNDFYSKLREDTVSKNFKKILRKLNLSDDFTFHSLRHSAITELILNNVPITVVKEIAGHKSISTTMGYAHVRSEDMKLAVNTLSY